MQSRERERERKREREGEHLGMAEWLEPQHADQMLPICQSKQLSFQRQHPTIWWLIIDNLRLCCLLTSPLSLSVSVSLPSLTSSSLPKIRHRLQHESCRPVFGSVTSDFAAGAIHSATPPAPPSTRARRHTHTHIHTHNLCCYGTCQVATGTLISPLIRLLNPGVDSIQPSFVSEKSRRKTPRCLTLQKLTRVPSPHPLLSAPISSSETPSFLPPKWKGGHFLTRRGEGVDFWCWISCLHLFQSRFLRWPHGFAAPQSNSIKIGGEYLWNLPWIILKASSTDLIYNEYF